MKKLILAAVAFTTVLTVNAQSDIKQADSTAVAIAKTSEDPQKVQIKIEELPAAVQTALKSNDFTGWTAKTAYVVKSEIPYYEVEMTNAKAEKNIVKFKEDGSVID